MDLNQMMVFAKVVQAGSFTAAARLLEMPKSTVSRKVSELEDHLGARLIQRTTRKLGLTDAGRIYYEHAARMVAEAEEAEQAVTRMQTAPRGLLRVTAPLAFTMLGPIVAEFLSRNPDVQVELYCSDRQVDLVEEGFDVAIRAGRLADSSLISRSLGAIKRVLVAAPSYCKKHGTPRTPAELSAHACIAFGAGPMPSVWTLFSGDDKAEVRLTPRLTVNDPDIQLDAVRAGVGIAVMAEFSCAGELRAGRLKQVLPDWSTSEVPVQALVPTVRHLSPKVQAFIELVAARIGQGLNRSRG